VYWNQQSLWPLRAEGRDEDHMFLTRVMWHRHFETELESMKAHLDELSGSGNEGMNLFAISACFGAMFT